MVQTFRIPSPKRTKKARMGWDGFFPYYAGFSEQFARELISSSGLKPGSLVHDPWNGSGTTTYAASTQDTLVAIKKVRPQLKPFSVLRKIEW